MTEKRQQRGTMKWLGPPELAVRPVLTVPEILEHQMICAKSRGYMETSSRMKRGKFGPEESLEFPYRNKRKKRTPNTKLSRKE